MPLAACDRAIRLAQRLSDSEAGSSLLLDHSLAHLTTYRTGGPAKLIVTADNFAELKTVAQAVADESSEAGSDPMPVLVVGRGSNLLISDRGFDGLVVLSGHGLKHFQIGLPETEFPCKSGNGVVCLTAGGGVLMPMLARACANVGLTGFEWAVGIPGTIGGAVRMNAGCHGSDISDVLVSATVVDLRGGVASEVAASKLDLDYRSSNLSEYQVVAAVKLRLTMSDTRTVLKQLAQVVGWRRANQPGGRNAGSVFMNPFGDSAGRLIESIGGKGLRVSTAAVSSKHANFIQVDLNGRSQDVLALMTEIHGRVRDTHGVNLNVETRLVGFLPEETRELQRDLV